MKKNIWIFNHYASDTFFDKGGRHYWIAHYLKENGYNPVIFVANSIHGKKDYYFTNENLYSLHVAESINVPYVFVKTPSYCGNGKERVRNMIAFYLNLIKTAKRYSKENKVIPDIILASSVHPLTLLAGIKLSKHFGVECISEIRDLWPESIVAYGILKKDNPVTKILYVGEKYLYKHSDKIVMTWAGGYKYIEDKKWDTCIPKSKVYNICNGVDIESFEKNAEIKRYSKLFEQNNCFVYTGSIRKVNNVELLVDAAIRLKSYNSDAMILVFGDGDEKEALEQKAREYKTDNIKFMGKVKKDEIPGILKQSYALILHNTSTSLDKYGQSQNKFYEYLAAGKPILMTYSVGYSIVEKEKCGFELKEQNADNIAYTIDMMCNLDRNEYELFCTNSRLVSRRYDFKNLTNKLIAVLENREEE